MAGAVASVEVAQEARGNEEGEELHHCGMDEHPAQYESRLILTVCFPTGQRPKIDQRTRYKPTREIGAFRFLLKMSLYSNKVSSRLPSQIGELADLEYLWIDNNRMGGPLPSEIGRLCSEALG